MPCLDVQIVSMHHFSQSTYFFVHRDSSFTGQFSLPLRGEGQDRGAWLLGLWQLPGACSLGSRPCFFVSPKQLPLFTFSSSEHFNFTSIIMGPSTMNFFCLSIPSLNSLLSLYVCSHPLQSCSKTSPTRRDIKYIEKGYTLIGPQAPHSHGDLTGEVSGTYQAITHRLGRLWPGCLGLYFTSWFLAISFRTKTPFQTFPHRA